MCSCTPYSFEQLTHKIWLKFGQWLGGESVTDGRTDGCTDIHFVPSPGLQGAVQKSVLLHTHPCEQLTYQIRLDFVHWFRRR